MNGNPDAFTRRPGDLPERGDERLKNMDQVVLKPQNLLGQLHLSADSPPAQGRPCISDLMTIVYGSDPRPGRIFEAIRTKNQLQEITIAECIENRVRMRYIGNLYVPDNDELRLRIIQEHHDTALAGHLGQTKHLTCLIVNSIRRKCVRMMIGMFGIAMTASSPDVQDIPPLRFFGIYLYQKNHAKIFRWIVLWDYHSVKGLMQYG